ncbi:MAG: hypothetical protein ACR2MP_29580 [Streptosporangiaceae bacterium]
MTVAARLAGYGLCWPASAPHSAPEWRAAGDFRPTPMPAADRTVRVDGYTVNLTGTLQAGREPGLAFTVAKDGRPVTDPQPCPGGYGHLAALRAGDLAHSHIHPQDSAGDGHSAAGPRVRFHAGLPTAAACRLFPDFRTGDRVHPAALTSIQEGDPPS